MGEAYHFAGWRCHNAAYVRRCLSGMGDYARRRPCRYAYYYGKPRVVLPDTTVDQFYAHIVRLNNENTAGKYRLAAQKFVEFCAYNRLTLDSLPRGVLTFFAETLTANGLAPSSVSVMTAGAKRYLKWLQDKGAIVPNLSSPDLPKITRQIPNALKDEDLVAFFHYAAKCPPPVNTAILLLPYCGLRSNELTNLTLSSVRRIDVPAANGGKVPHICFTVKGKGGDYRTVPLLLDGQPLLLQYLRGWRSTQRGEYLFPTEGDGSPISNRTLRHYVQWIREQMKASGRDHRRLTPHTLRRTYVTTLWKAGLDVPTLVKIIGHKNVQTTMTHYLEIQPEDLAGAVGRSGAYLIAKGQYADDVRDAQADIAKFLESYSKKKENP